MREPIRTKAKASGAARAIHYSVAILGAWLIALAIGACSQAESEPLGSAAAASRSTRSAESPAAPEPNRSENESSGSTRPAIVFLGTSLTAGYGLPESQAFPALIQTRLDEEGLDYRVVNAGVSGDTSAGGLRRLSWLLRLPIAALVVELGANDMLRGQSVEALRSNLEKILERTSNAHPDARFLIAGMRAAPNLGREYGRNFDATYPALAKKYDAGLVPFILEDVAAKRQLNQADGIHPTAEGHALIADRIWPELRSLLRQVAHRESNRS